MEFIFEDKCLELCPAPETLQDQHRQLFTLDALEFLTNFVSHFQPRAVELQRARKQRKINFDITGNLPVFKTDLASKVIHEADWKISPLPAHLRKRQVDLGDISPSNEILFQQAVCSGAQGVQVDFDDGECPSWPNMIKGLHNIISYIRGTFKKGEVPDVKSGPVLMLRPRAWNMIEHNVMVNGREIPGPLMDIGLLLFHGGKILAQGECGPYFYLSKIECSTEAMLWNDIFVWTQLKLGIPRGTIKACVLIENILAAFEMDEILYELRDHSLGLNCGIWDYAASIVTKFGDRPNFLLPDRSTYVNIQNPFLLTYIRFVVKTCHRRGAPATGGMAALTTFKWQTEKEKEEVAALVCKAKLREIEEGVDGFLVYDPYLLPKVNVLWERFGDNQIDTVKHDGMIIKPGDLLEIPGGEVTTAGVQRNIKVSLLFIYSWLGNAKGHFELGGGIEDSATAEISRSQIWQYIFHQTKLADEAQEKITKAWIQRETLKLAGTLDKQSYDQKILQDSVQIFLEIVTTGDFPEFITTYLYNHSIFRTYHKT